MTPVEFRGDLWRQKTRVFGVSYGVVCVILRLAVLVELRLVTDRRTRTDRHGPMASVGREEAAAVTSAAMVGGCREVTTSLLLLVVDVAVVIADSAVI